MRWFIVLYVYFYSDCAFCSPYVTSEPVPNNTDIGEPLFLTPYIEAGKIEEGQDAARVRLSATNITSYSGYLTVNKTFNSNLFFWFFPSEKDPQNASVLLWLQGGPGSSSMIGLFTENGPFYISEQGLLNERQFYWSQLFNVIYIDNPVGTGFSFTEANEGYANDQVKIGQELYSALIQFFQLFPHLQKNEFFLSGESYAGKYIPAVGYTIYIENKVKNQKINLKGLAIGNGFTDPENMMVFADHVYQIGLIDSKTRELICEKQDIVLKYIRRKHFKMAVYAYYALMDLVHGEADSDYFSIYNYLQSPESTFLEWMDYLQSLKVRISTHVGNRRFNNHYMVSNRLWNDNMQSVKPWVEVLMDNYRVMFYSGQLDVLVSYPMTLNFLKKLNWSGAEMYRTAPRKRWMVEGELAGFAKSVKGFTEVLVLNAGHSVPKDQPKRALDLINRFVNNIPF